jgi:transcriptional regulator with XRE-family HTH domain
MNRLKSYRESLLLSKSELARRCGLSVLTIDRIERGHSCRMDTKRKILASLGLPISDAAQIFGESEVNRIKEIK